MKSGPLSWRLREIENFYGGQCAACRALYIDPAYWSRLHTGAKENPSDLVKQKLGIHRRYIVYEWKEGNDGHKRGVGGVG